MKSASETAQGSSDQFEFQLSESLHTTSDGVAGFEPYLLVPEFAQDHTFRSTGEDNVTWLERHQSRGVANELTAVENKIIGV
jgi:hypothetical protein